MFVDITVFRLENFFPVSISAFLNFARCKLTSIAATNQMCLCVLPECLSILNGIQQITDCISRLTQNAGICILAVFEFLLSWYFSLAEKIWKSRGILLTGISQRIWFMVTENI